MAKISGNSEETEGSSTEWHKRATIAVDGGQEPIRIDKFLVGRLEHTSRNKIKKSAEEGMIKVNGSAVRTNYKVRPGDEIIIFTAREPIDTRVLPEDIPLDIRYEDDTIIVVHKPAGMVVHPAHGNYTGTLLNGLAWHLGYRSKEGITPGVNRFGLVHRIDKDTSGLLVIGKTEAALNELASQFYHHTTERTYKALVWGNFEEEIGRIEAHIGRHPRFRKKMTAFPDGSQGKQAITHYKVLEDFHYVSLIECQLETGRTHQIRVHMQWLGHPLFNDQTYGGDSIRKGTVFNKYKQFVNNCFKLLPRQALHAQSLGFVHPTTGKKMVFDSELPEDMQAAIDKWRKYVSIKRF